MAAAAQSFFTITQLQSQIQPQQESQSQSQSQDNINASTTSAEASISNVAASSILSKQLLNDFSVMLTEGIYSFAGTNPIASQMTKVKVRLSNQGRIIKLIPAKQQVSSLSSSSTSPISTKNIDSEVPHSLYFSSTVSIVTLHVISVCEDLDDNTLIVLSVIDAKAKAGQGGVLDIYIKTIDGVESEALLAGLHIFFVDLRNKVTRSLSRVLKILKCKHELQCAFGKWKNKQE